MQLLIGPRIAALGEGNTTSWGVENDEPNKDHAIWWKLKIGQKQTTKKICLFDSTQTYTPSPVTNVQLRASRGIVASIMYSCFIWIILMWL